MDIIITPDVIGQLAGLIRSWITALRAENKSQRTIETYGETAHQLLAFLQNAGMPTAVSDIHREHVEAYLTDMFGRGCSSGTASLRYRSLQPLFKWLVAEGEIKASPMRNMKPPKVEETVMPLLSEDQLRAVLKTANGSGYRDRRDTAILRLYIDTPVRASELVNLQLEDVCGCPSTAIRTRGLPYSTDYLNADRLALGRHDGRRREPDPGGPWVRACRRASNKAEPQRRSDEPKRCWSRPQRRLQPNDTPTRPDGGRSRPLRAVE